MTRHSKLICQSDKNSTYRLLGNRQNLLSLWNVNDRIRVNHDDNLPYGFKIKSEHKDNKVRLDSF